MKNQKKPCETRHLAIMLLIHPNTPGELAKSNAFLLSNLIEYSKIKLIPPPAFINTVWDDYIDIAGPEKILKLHELMGCERYSCNTPYQYLLKRCAFNLFMMGNTAYDAFALFDIPDTTARGYYAEFKEYLKKLGHV